MRSQFRRNLFHWDNKALISVIAVIFALGFALIGKSVLAANISSREVMALTNEARRAEGIQAMTMNSVLEKAAQEKAQDMLAHNYFAHISPQGLTPWYWIEKNNYEYRYAGENLAINFANAAQQQRAWMDSPTHRKNILNAKYSETGVAVAKGLMDGKEVIVTVQLFGAPVGFAQMASAQTENVEVIKDSGLVKGSAYEKDFAWKVDQTALFLWILILFPMMLFVGIDTLRIITKRNIRNSFAQHSIVENG